MRVFLNPPREERVLRYGSTCLEEWGRLPGLWAGGRLFSASRRLSADPILDAFARAAGSVRVEEDAGPRGWPLLTLFVNDDLRWIVLVPGSGVLGRELPESPWRWRVQDYASQRQAETELSTVAELLPSAADLARELHGRAIDRLAEHVAAGESEMEPDLRRLELELRSPAESPREFARADRADRWPIFQAVRVSLRPAPGMVAESGRGLKVGDERAGRFRAMLSPRENGDGAEKSVEVEVDVKRSLVTLHSIDGSAPVAVGGEPIGNKLSIPVVAGDETGERCVLRLGRPLDGELERVVGVG